MDVRFERTSFVRIVIQVNMGNYITLNVFNNPQYSRLLNELLVVLPALIY